MSIRAKFRIRRGEFTLDVDLDVPSRRVTAIFGPSGCGKTTLLRLTAGLDRDPAGYLRVGEELWQDGKSFVPTHRRALGYVFQEGSLFAHLTVRGNLEYGYKRIAADRRRVAMDEAVELLGLRGMMDRDPAGLSGGERQRVAIARTLLTSPSLLLMDEPLASLDAESRAGIIPYLERLHEQLETPVLYVTHSFDEVARLADHLVLMRAGRIAGSGPLIEMMNRADGPLAGLADAESIIEATVAEHDEGFHLTRLAFAAGSLTAPRTLLPVGRTVRVRVFARDVSLTTLPPAATSILNILPATVLAVGDAAAGQADVRLDIGGGFTLLARITRKSAAALGLAPGTRVFAQVKSVALTEGSPAGG